MERKSAAAAESSTLPPPCVHLSLYAAVFPFSQPSSSQPCLHCNYLVGHFSVHGRPVVYLSSLYWEALGRAGEWSYLTSRDSPGVCGLFGAGKTRAAASASSIPIAELKNAALFITEIEWLYLLYSSPLAVNQGN